jgi:type IV pilus assembly protein PilY1
LVTGLLSTPVVKGWYIDLGNDPTSGYAWRVDIKPAAYNGTVSFAAFLPSGNACALSGLGEIYSVNYATATSVLTSQPTGYYAVPAAVVNLNYIGLSSTSSSSTNAELIAGLANGTVIKIPETLNATTSTRLLNWRELPSVQ